MKEKNSKKGPKVADQARTTGIPNPVKGEGRDGGSGKQEQHTWAKRRLHCCGRGKTTGWERGPPHPTARSRPQKKRIPREAVDLRASYDKRGRDTNFVAAQSSWGQKNQPERASSHQRGRGLHWADFRSSTFAAQNRKLGIAEKRSPCIF